MKVFVIGGSGFIGTYLVGLLKKEKHIVKIFDKQTSCLYGELVEKGDVRDRKHLFESMNGFDVVINLAAEHRDDVTPSSLYYDVNVQGAQNIVEAADNNSIKRIIFTSSVAVYGLNKLNPDEKSPTHPFNHYGKSKLQAEEIYNKWLEAGDGRSLTILRPVVVFGEGNRGNVFNLIKQIQTNKFMMVGIGENKKSMAYVGNVAEFLIRSLEFGIGKHLYNIATKPDLTVRELVDLIRSELGIHGKMPALPYALGLMGGIVFDLLAKVTGRKFPVSSVRIRKFCANTTVSTEALESTGFKSPYTLEDGIKRMIRNLDENIYFEGGG